MSDLNVLFVYTNINGTHEETYSFGLASIVSYTKKNGYFAKVIIVKNRDDYNTLFQTLTEFKPRVVAFTSVSSQFVFVSELASDIKKLDSGIITVCGGVHTTIFPECLLEAPSLDGIFIGESELSFAEFLGHIDKNEPYTGTMNFCHVISGKLVINPLVPFIPDLDVLPYPDKTTYPYKDTVSLGGIAPFMFSRGCPFLCSYCSNHAIAKIYGIKHNNPRYRGPESSIREIEETLRQLPEIQIVWIMDDTFGLDKQWRNEFCLKYKERIEKKFYCNLRANIIDEEFIRILKDAGCCHILIGVESGNEYIRNEVMNRHMSNQQLINAFTLARKYGITTNAINIIGVPGETEEMIWDTIRLNRQLKPTSSGVNIFYPYKGTQLGDYCVKKGLFNEDEYRHFSSERRESVLNYPEEYKKKLNYYYNHWEELVYPYDIGKRMHRMWMHCIIMIMNHPRLLQVLRTIKHTVIR